MALRPSAVRRLRKGANRRLYGGLFRVYRRIFPSPPWTGPPRPEALRRILVVQRYGVGDMILTTPLLAFLKDRLRHAEIDVLASTRNASVISGDRCVTRVFVHDGSWRGWLRILPRLRDRRYDLVISGQAGSHLAEGLSAVAVSHRTTYRLSVWRPKRYHGLFTVVVRLPPSVTHTADRLLYVARRVAGASGSGAGDAGTRYPVRMATDAAAEARAEAFVREHGLGRGFVVVTVSSQFAERDWPPRHCAACLSLLLDRHPDLVVVLTPALGKSAPARQIAAALGAHPVLVAPELQLLDLAALVARALAVLSPNTALVHIAAARKRPVVALYTTQAGAEPPLWLPLGVPYRALASRHGARLDDIPPADVATAFDELRREVERSSNGVAVTAEGR